MSKLKNLSDERGVSVVLGAMLVIGIIIAVFATFINSWIPNERNRLAQEHAKAVRDSFGKLQTAIDGLEEDRSTVVDVQMNPGQVTFFGGATEAGTLSTEPWAHRKENFDRPCSASARVDNSNPDNNFPKWASVLLEQGKEWRSFVKFNLVDIRSMMPENARAISSVHLQLYVDRGYVGNTPTVEVWGVDNNSWNESTITWNNKPQPDRLLDNITISSGSWSYQWFSWDVTSWVMERYQEDTVSFCLKTTTDNSYVFFNPRGSGKDPRLEFELDCASGAAVYVSSHVDNMGTILNFENMKADDGVYATLKGDYCILANGNGSSDPHVYGGIYGTSSMIGSNSLSIFSASPDPTFGYTTIGTLGTTQIGFPGTDFANIAGSVFTCTENGTADSITVYLDIPFGNARAAIYNHSTGALVGQTEERFWDWGQHDFPEWDTFNFSSPKPSLVAGTDYILVAWAWNIDDYSYANMYYDNGDGTIQGHIKWEDTGGWGNFPSSITNFTHQDAKYSIYCTYTPSAAPGKPILVSPENNTATDTIPTFTWTRGSNADNHRIEVDNDDNWANGCYDNHWISSPNDNTYTPTIDYPFGTYYWRVWAINAAGENCSENTWKFTTVIKPTKPILYLPVNENITDDNTPYFEWRKGMNATSHRLLVADNPDFSSPKENRTFTMDNFYTILDNESLPDDTYYWEVIAINENGETPSDVWTFFIGHYVYAMNIELTIKNAPLSSARLEMGYRLDNSNDYFLVKVWDWSENIWHPRGDKLDSLSWSEWSYPLTSNEVAENGDVRVKIVNANPRATATDLQVDYLRVRGPRTYGSIEFLEPNVTPAQTYIYEDGAVILVQSDRVLMISRPTMITASQANGDNIRVDVHRIIVSSSRKSTNEGGTRGIRVKAKSSWYIVSPSGGPNCSSVSVTIQSDYKDAWMEYFESVYRDLEAKGFVTGASPPAGNGNTLTLKIDGKKGPGIYDIYYYEKVTEIEVSFV